jgi:hypothetical protein
MSADPAYAMQFAIVTALKASAGLATAMGGSARIFDPIPQNPTYPFVRVGEDQTLDDANGCDAAWEMFATLHVFARPIDGLGARMVAKRVGSAIVPALSGALSPAGFVVTEQEFESSRYFMEADGVTAHGVLVFRFLIDPA